jgi:hypothetical protein
MSENYLLKDVAKHLGVRPYRIAYAISVSHVPEPETRIANNRIFDTDDIRRLAVHFGVEPGGKAGSRKKGVPTALGADDGR